MLPLYFYLTVISTLHKFELGLNCFYFGITTERGQNQSISNMTAYNNQPCRSIFLEGNKGKEFAIKCKWPAFRTIQLKNYYQMGLNTAT